MTKLNFPFRARSKCGNFLVPFILEDGPCPVDAEHFVLTERPGSPILRYDSILRGFDIEGLFEGDIVTLEEENNENEYIILYSKGLKLKSVVDGKEKFYKYDGKINIVSNIYTRELKFITRDVPKFKLGDSYVFLSAIYGMHDGKLLLNTSEQPSAKPEDLCALSGLRTTKGKFIYYGQYGLTLRNGELGRYNENTFLSFADGEINLEELC